MAATLFLPFLLQELLTLGEAGRSGKQKPGVWDEGKGRRGPPVGASPGAVAQRWTRGQRAAPAATRPKWPPPSKEEPAPPTLLPLTIERMPSRAVDKMAAGRVTPSPSDGRFQKMTTANKTPPGADPKQLERTGTVREIGSQAVWSLSSCKPGFGVDQLRDDNLETYWQSDGSQPHLVNIQFRRKTTVKTLCIYADYKSDESYTPSKISVRVGNNFHNLQEIRFILFYRKADTCTCSHPSLH
ncbi:hypothetical protein JD844_026759 [Phrynosoma platyrhinos]|uniref:Anaphase-promoting complex subunit 10 n=1 Tax=Phrynosoma platyrhinos TaxID=52577 RepID=A0ABQ7SF99_PHRPL|nr:hypothetical protein JD844_026759 [Phrynosoma platyrhinos]